MEDQMTNRKINKTPSHRLNKKIREELKSINTSAFVDVMARQFGYNPRYVLMNNVMPLNDGSRLVARAMTVRYLPARPDFDEMKPKNEKSPEYAAFEIAGPGDVIVMDSMETSLMSIGGDIKFLRLKQRGIDGLVCDGGVRDMGSVEKYNIRIWGYGKTSNLGTMIGTPCETNEPVKVDGILVMPGDYIVADDDGVVVIPRIICKEVADAAIEYDRLEEWIKNKLSEENLSPGKYYPPDERTYKEYKKNQ